MSRVHLWVACVGIPLLSCRSEETRVCLEQFEAAQAVVRDVDSSKQASVEASLTAVTAAHAACAAADRHRETEELLQAKNQLSGHLAYMKQKANQRESRQLTAEQLADLVKSGDPSCPKGQAYKHRDTGKEIRCRGPQPAVMAFDEAKDYFEGRGHTVKVDGNTLRAEYGSEVLLYRYAKPGDSRPPTCLKLYPPEGMSWQEATSRVTGIPPHRLEPPAPLQIEERSVPFSVQDGKGKLVIALGDCEL